MPVEELEADQLLGAERGSAAGERRVQWDDYSWPVAVGHETEPTAAQIEDMLRRDGRARAIEQVLTLPIRSTEHTVQGDGPAGELLTSVLDGLDIPLDTVIAQMAGAAIHRRACFELQWGVVDGRIVPVKIASRPVATCKLKTDDRTGDIDGFVQTVVRKNGVPEKVTIPRSRSLVVLANRHLAPLDGKSDMEGCWSQYQDRQKVRFLYHDFLENQSLPKAIGKHSNNDASQQQQFARQIASLKGGGAMAHGPDQEVKPYESSGRGAAEFREAMGLHAREMAASVLAGFLDLTAGTAGSYALSRDQSDFFLQSRQAVLSEIQSDFNRQVTDRMLAVNLGPAAVGTAKLVFSPLAREHVAESFTLLQSMAAMAPDELPSGLVGALAEQVAGRLGLKLGSGA